MSNDKTAERAAFEAWAMGPNGRGLSAEKWPNGNYKSEDMHDDWTAWRAALSSRPVQDLYERLAEAHDASLDDDHRACRSILTECMSLLALSSVPAREQWQPIETAPKDGERLIVWWAGRPRIGRCAGVGASRDGGDWWQVPSMECAPTGRPTHWMPLPAAPGATAEPAPAREPMTEREILDLVPTLMPIGSDFELLWFARAIERHHGICKE